MKMESKVLEQAEMSLRECLSDIPFVELDRIQVEPGDLDPPTDMKAWLDLPDGEMMLLLDVEASGQPRIVRNTVNQIRRRIRQYPRAYGIFVAPYVSPTSARILSENDMGYLDFAGNCRLSFRTVFISKEGRSNPFTQKRDLCTLYSRKAARVLRVLLTHPGRAWRTQELASEANVSLGQVANVKKLLEDREWMRSDSEGMRLVEPESLLAEWAGNYSNRRNEIRQYYSPKSPPELESDLADACGDLGIRYALTGFSSAARLAPFVRYQRAMAYIQDDQERLAGALGLKEVDSGANVSLIVPYDEGVFYGGSKVDGVIIASPVQTYLDLLGIRGRGEEAARFLLQEVIRKQWQ